MQFKRWRLSVARPLVNVALGISLLFGMAACSKQDSPEQRPPVENEAAQPGLPPGVVELPVVWATSALEGPVRDIALASGIGGTLAVAYKGSGLQLFTLEGDRMAQIANFKVDSLASGFSTSFDGVDVSMFPAINRGGILTVYIYGEGLVAPAEVPLPIDEPRSALGLCALKGDPSETALFHLAYWTTDDNRLLKTGTINVKNGDFIWTPGAATTQQKAITACGYVGRQAVSVPDATDAANFVRGEYATTVTLTEGGQLVLLSPEGKRTLIRLRDGLSVAAPETPRAIGALGVPLSGGYPGGLIVLVGEVAGGESQVVFVDPSPLLTPPDEVE